MPNFKVIYFPYKGLAEPIRFIFSYAGRSFDDQRLIEKFWPEYKLTTPYGQLPMLIVDRRKVAQSVAISRFLAKQFGIAGKNDWEAMHIDATVDTIHDIRLKLASFHYEKDETRKAEKRKEAEESLAYFLERLDAQVKEHGGFFYGGTISWADLTFVALLDYFNYMYKSDLIANYENLKQLREKILKLPKIKTWLEKRPDSEY